MVDRVLSQEEIDDVFRNLRDAPAEEDPALRAEPYDFRRPDRIAKDQLRAIHLLHENFARSLAVQPFRLPASLCRGKPGFGGAALFYGVLAGAALAHLPGLTWECSRTRATRCWR